MRILYVTSVWTSLFDVLYEGTENMNGMPAFEKVLKRLVLDDNEVDMLLYDFRVNKKESYNIQSSWFRKVNILNHLYIGSMDGIKKLPSYFRIYEELKNETIKAIKARKYDFVYGHGPVAVASNIVCNRYNIPFGQRMYGDTFYTFAQRRGQLYSIIVNPLTYLSYKTKKDFMIATNDGSGINKAYKRIGLKDKYDFYFWLNGVDFEETQNQETKINVKKPYLLYIARIAKWKQQHLAIEIIKKLKETGIELHLYFAGQITDDEYYDGLIDLINQYNLNDLAEYVGVIENTDISELSKNALACLSLYDICNLGNVFLEYIASGGLVISLNDGSLDDIIIHGENGFLIDNIEQAVEIISKIYNSEINSKNLKDQSYLTARRHIKTWDNRVKDEIALIENTAKRGVE